MVNFESHTQLFVDNKNPRNLVLVSCDMTGIQGIMRAFPSDSIPVVYCPDDTIRAILDRFASNGPHPAVHVFADFVNNLTFTRSNGDVEESALREWATELKRSLGTESITLYNRPVECIGQDVFDAYCQRVAATTQVAIKRTEFNPPQRSQHARNLPLILISQDTPSDLIRKAMGTKNIAVLYNSNPDFGVEYMLYKIRLELMGSVTPLMSSVPDMRALGVKRIEILPPAPDFVQALKSELGLDVQVIIHGKKNPGNKVLTIFTWVCSFLVAYTTAGIAMVMGRRRPHPVA